MNLEKYKDYTFLDFLEDADFRKGVLNPTNENTLHWQKVMDTYPEQKEEIEKARNTLKEMETFFMPSELKNRPLNNAFVAELKKEAAQHRLRPNTRRIFLRRASIAASILILISLSFWFGIVQPQQMQIVATQYGEWENISLPDGSEVQLNANSEIRFAKNWKAGKDRKVWLEGEAFFEVEKDAVGAKFTVYTDDLAVEVLGTAFNVNTRKTQTEVFLEEGSVRLDLGSSEQLMVPGELVVYSSEEQKITEYRKASAERHISWKDGSLILRDESVKVIFDKLEEVFGYTVVAEEEELLSSIKTIAIPMDDIDSAIPILEITLEVKISKEDDQLIIK